MTWKPWNSTDIPPAGQVDIRLRCGKEVKETAARKWLWGAPANDNGNTNGGVIVAYREIGEAA